MDADGNNLWIFILILVLFILIKAFVNACHYALIEVNDSKVRSMAEKDKKYSRLLDLISKPSEMLAAFSVCRIVLDSVILLTAFIVFSHYLNGFMTDITGINILGMKIYEAVDGTSETVYVITTAVSYLLFILIASIIINVFTEIIPVRFAEKNTDSLALKCVPFIHFIIAFFKPLRKLCSLFAFVFSKLLGLPTSDKKDVVTEEEILMMVEAGNETGVIEESQRTMINNIFEFGDSVVSEVMTHRTDIIAVDVNEKIHDIVYLAINEGFSRIPVYENNIDTIIGIICVKDLLCLVGCEHSEDFNIRDFMRETMYIPETNKCSEVFETMTLKKTQMAVIVDEYGGTAGIVTIEDLLEEIVGNIQDEYDDDEREFEKISDNIFTFLGSADPKDVFPKLQLELPENFQYDTMSAFIVDLLGRIPADDEMPSVKYKNIEFTVLIVEDNWISKIKAVICKDNE